MTSCCGMLPTFDNNTSNRMETAVFKQNKTQLYPSKTYLWAEDFSLLNFKSAVKIGDTRVSFKKKRRGKRIQ